MNRAYPFDRSSGILLHPTSLPAPFGIGDFGPAAYRFVDFLTLSDQQLWQMCPLGPTGYGDSPYQCFSSLAGNPMLISLELLAEQDLLTQQELTSAEYAVGTVDYGRVQDEHWPLLISAFGRFKTNAGELERHRFDRFCRKNAPWLEDFALFMVLKADRGGAPWYEWEDELIFRSPAVLDSIRRDKADALEFQRFVQFQFDRQWQELKHYANARNVKMIGDMPVFAAHDSADAWAHPHLFELDSELRPVAVAGVPPDYFSPTGQLWGNPVYRWDAHRNDRFQWWISIFKGKLAKYDFLRVDHFRGFSAYWRIPFGQPTAENGRWVSVPGKELFDRLSQVLPTMPIIAEDLGVITDDVVELIDYCGFPRMKVLQFGFDSAEANEYLPHTYERNSIAYTGTHDNDTVLGWYQAVGERDKSLARDYLNSDGSQINWDFIRAVWSSTSQLAIAPLQDVLGLGSEGRMNLPGTTGGNWQWRMRDAEIPRDLVERLRHLTGLYGRLTA